MKKFKPELASKPTSAFQADAGTKVGELATQLFPNGTLVDRAYWEVEEAALETSDLISNRNRAVFEAMAIHPKSGDFARADILEPDSENSWNLIEVKSSTRVKSQQILDLAFQYYVFSSAGIEISSCFVLHLNSGYLRDNTLQLEKLFKRADVTSEVLELQKQLTASVSEIDTLLEQRRLPETQIGAKCKSPRECEFLDSCWADVPVYSVFNALREPKASQLAEKYGFGVETIPKEYWPGGNKALEIKSFISDEPAVNQAELFRFCETLQYPLYFLDFETVNPAVPPFKSSKPYEQIPFQFSCHYASENDGSLEHHEFIHMHKSDPRRAFAESLLSTCNDTGSILVYNRSFESGCVRNLAVLYPELSDQLLAINDRMVDLYVPFRNRWLYHPKQMGSASIKYVLPAFTDLSYAGLNIANGGVAMAEYQRFLDEDLSAEETAALRQNLSKYCELDTFAMVEILRVVQQYANHDFGNTH